MEKEQELAVQMWHEIAEVIRSRPMKWWNKYVLRPFPHRDEYARRIKVKLPAMKKKFMKEHGVDWDSSCWLCHNYSCVDCPLYKATGKVCHDPDSLHERIINGHADAADCAETIAAIIEGIYKGIV